MLRIQRAHQVTRALRLALHVEHRGPPWHIDRDAEGVDDADDERAEHADGEGRDDREVTGPWHLGAPGARHQSRDRHQHPDERCRGSDREVELAGYYNRSAKDLRSLLNGLGLAVPSTHHALRDLLTDTQKQIDYVAELGVRYLVIPFPATADNRFDNQPSGAAKTISNSTTLDDWKWMAAQLNRIGELSRKAGIRTGYHNHNIDFRSIDGVVAYDQLINSTDPARVTFELDVGFLVQIIVGVVENLNAGYAEPARRKLQDWFPHGQRE